MSNLGVGVMLGMLAGNADSAKVFSGAIGKEIAKLELIKGDGASCDCVGDRLYHSLVPVSLKRRGSKLALDK